MTPEPSPDNAIRQELLRGALVNSSRSVPLQLGALLVIVLLGVNAGQAAAALVIGALTVVAVTWRLSIARLFNATTSAIEANIQRAQRQLRVHAALAGGTWVVAALTVYPHLQGPEATVFVLLACASVAVAAFFMPMAGGAFALLTTVQLGGVIVGALVHPHASSVALAAAIALYAIAMVMSRRELTRATLRATRHAVEADAANRSLLAAKEAAESANLAKSQFLATMSHEIRTPMNGVLGALELLRHSKLDSQQRRLVRTAASSGETLMRILNDVLDHSKIEAGKLNLTAAPMALHHVVGSVVALFRANADAKGLALDLELEPEVPNAVVGDAQRLKQVLLNLVGNAIKFTEHGSVTLRVHAVDQVDKSVRVLFEVRDSGLGIDAQALSTLFQPFHQVHAARHRRGGTGLGLAISARIVEAMGGRIEVESVVQRGSTFRFTLAFERDPAPATSVADSILGSLDERQPHGGTVLLVEDNAVNRMIAHQMLRSLGLEVVEAGDGEQAIELLDTQPVDLVLMDCNMPVMDGYDATRRIRDRETTLGLPRLPIIAVTANAFDEDAARALEAGMDAHLAKPYTRDQLRELIASYL